MTIPLSSFHLMIIISITTIEAIGLGLYLFLQYLGQMYQAISGLEKILGEKPFEVEIKFVSVFFKFG